ncbi:hypothetical protein [Microbacterium oxydans]|uniref:hypothetical protein n=1 Tax=Microbacterium oxydans TaxID=82380 RepID=UPI0037CAF579
MDDRILRLWDKAEQAIDRNDNDQADSYRTLANTVAYQRRKEARSLERELYYLRDNND